MSPFRDLGFSGLYVSYFWCKGTTFFWFMQAKTKKSLYLK